MELQKIDEFINQGISVNTQDIDGKTAILIATEMNNPELVSTLIKYGADIDFHSESTDIIDMTPFLYAGANGLNNILDILIPYSPDVSIRNGYGGNALIPACEKGYLNTVKKLLEETDIDVNLVNNLGWTALLEAIILSDGGTDHQEIIKLLLKHGADITISDKEGLTPLKHSINKGFEEIQKILEDYEKIFYVE